jgi:hypothetical protein
MAQKQKPKIVNTIHRGERILAEVYLNECEGRSPWLTAQVFRLYGPEHEWRAFDFGAGDCTEAIKAYEEAQHWMWDNPLPKNGKRSHEAMDRNHPAERNSAGTNQED